MSVRTARLLLLAGFTAAVAAVLVAGGWEWLSDGDRVEAFFTERGAIGPIVFVVLMWLVQPWGVPGAFFMVPAAVVWPLPVAMGLSWIGNMGASTIAFGFARWVGHDWAQARLPDRLRRWDDRLASGGVVEVTMLRLLTGQIPPADWLLGVSQVRVPPFVVGTAVGIIPGIIVITTVGGSFYGWIGGEPRRLVVALVATVAVVLVVRRRRRVTRGRDRPFGDAERP